MVRGFQPINQLWKGVRCLGVAATLVLSIGGAQAQDAGVDQARLVVTCTSNLRAVYAAPVTARRLIGAEFLDQDQGPQTRAACEQLAEGSGDPAFREHRLLWLAYARLADGDRGAALRALANISAPGGATAGLADPRIRAWALWQHLAGTQENTETNALSDTLFPEQIEDKTAHGARLLDLAQKGLIGLDVLETTLLESQAFEALIALYDGSQVIQNQPLGPDLLKLRDLADRAAQHPDPLVSMTWLKRAAGYYQRGFEQQGLVAEPEQALWRLELAFGLGLAAWHQISLPADYREAVQVQTLPLVETLLAESQNPEVLFSIAQSIQFDWAGLANTFDAATAFEQAAQAGSARAKATQVLNALQRGELEGESGLGTLALEDSCVYDLWGKAFRDGLMTGRREPQTALAIFRQGQEAGSAAGFAGEAELLRWGLLNQGFDFKGAEGLFRQAISPVTAARCGREIPGNAHLILGWLYFTGQAGALDIEAARTQFLASQRQGGFAAAEALAEMYLFGLGVPRDGVLAHEFASKAFLHNRRQYQSYLALSFHQQLGLELPGLSLDQEGDLPLAPVNDAVVQFAAGATSGSFYGTYYLGLALMSDPALTRLVGGQIDGAALIAELASHVGAFERGLASDGPTQAQAFDAMRAELAGVQNLAFTAARYDSQAGIHYDPARALNFYRALGLGHPTVAKIMSLDRFEYLSPSARQEIGQGPITLTQIVELGLGQEMRPLPLHLFLTP